MKTGIELIAEERQEQIKKHRHTLKEDSGYKNYELIQAALFCIDQTVNVGWGLKTEIRWPINWAQRSMFKIKDKSTTDKLKVAGAFIAAEIDRLNKLATPQEVNERLK